MAFFGTTDVIGKQIEIRESDQYASFTVTAIAEDVPANSTIKFEMLGSLDRILNTPKGRESSNSWTMSLGGISVYVQLRPGSNLMNEAERLASFRQKYFPNEGADLKKEGLWNGQGKIPTGFGLQPLRDVHTNVTIDAGASDPKKIWMLIAISGGVLLIACINFIVLSVGRSASRSKEGGVRKISGSRSNQLMLQFLAESMLLTFFAALFGIGIVQVVLPFFNELSGSAITFSIHQYPEIIVLMLATVFVTGLLAGSYPAFVLSGFKPVAILKSNVRFTGSNIFTRSLVTFQFTLSVALIIGTVVILQQLSFMNSKDLGFEKEHMVMVYAQGTDTYEKFHRILESNTAIAAITGSVMGMGRRGTDG